MLCWVLLLLLLLLFEHFLGFFLANAIPAFLPLPSAGGSSSISMLLSVAHHFFQASKTPKK